MSELNDDPYAEAAEKGWDVVLPGDNELQIDIDDEESLDVYDEMVDVLESTGYYIVNERRTPSKGGNTHITVKVVGHGLTISPLERVALQAMLGSDRKRELLSLLRIWKPEANRPPTLFFEVQDEEAA